MQCKALCPFPVICVPHTQWRGFRGPPGPSLKAPPWAKLAAPLIPYLKITARSTVGLKGQDPRCTQCLAPLIAAPGPKCRCWRPAASPGAVRRSSAQGIPHWVALHFFVGKREHKGSCATHAHPNTSLANGEQKANWHKSLGPDSGKCFTACLILSAQRPIALFMYLKLKIK